MPIQYPGGVIVNATFVGATRQDIVTGIYDNLLLAGWTLVSGAANDRLMQSALTPQNLQCRVRIWDPGVGNAKLTFQSVDGLRVSGEFQLAPAGAKTFRIIACKFQFFVVVPGSLNANDAVGGGVPFLETFLVGSITESIWAQDLVWRQRLERTGGGGTWQTCNTNAWSSANPGGGHQRLLVANQSNKWHDGSGFKIPARIFWGLTSRTDESRCRGQLWGAVVSTNPNAMDLTTTFDGHNWLNLTESWPFGSLWIQIT